MENPKICPKDFGLHPRTVLENVDPQTIAIVIQRKSRIIMKDGQGIVEKALLIKKIRPKHTIALKTCAPICSKTLTLLKEHGITLITFDS